MKQNYIDPNLASPSADGTSFVFYDAHHLTLEGFPWENKNTTPYMRLPQDTLKLLPETLCWVQTFTAGGVVRFVTDSKALGIRVKYKPLDMNRVCTPASQGGFDITVRENGTCRLIANVCPEVRDFYSGKLEYELSCMLPGTMQEYRVYLPLYSTIESLEIGFEKDARIMEAPAHAVDKPIVFYGSSITQGGCASRPANTYTALVSSWLDVHMINLGFGGNARGEKEIAQAIAELDMSLFVLDYDHNAPTDAHLMETHELFFCAVREKNKDLPIIMLSRPWANISDKEDSMKRRNIIKRTYDNAVSKGDKNVYFIDGMEIYDGIQRDLTSVDLCHPTDLGFYIMAQKVYSLIRDIWG